MKNQAGKFRRPSLTTIMAALALFIVIGGTATAAGLINGKNIKKGTSTVSCGMQASNGGGSTSALWSSPVNNSRTTLALQLATPVATNHIELTCNPVNSLGSYDGSVILVPLG